MNETNPFFSYMYSEEEIDNQNTILISLPKYVIISPNGEIINNKALKPTFPTQNLILILFYIKINCNIYVIDF